MNIAIATDFAVFLRGISNVPMKPFREALSALGLTRVDSFGTSGNFVFCSSDEDRGLLEDRIGDALGTEAFVRSRDELTSIVAANPYADREGAAVFLAKRPIDEFRRTRMIEQGFEGDPPSFSESTIYFVHPTRRLGRKGVIDFERELDVAGTMRSSRVLARVLELMSARDDV